MRKTKFFLSCVATLTLMSFIAPVGVHADAQEAVPVIESGALAASTGNTAEVRQTNIYWRYKFLNGRTYKRLFDYEKSMWIGDWILVS